MRITARIAFGATCCILASQVAFAAASDVSAHFLGNRAQAAAVWSTFQTWLTSYKDGDLKGAMAIFDPAVEFVFQGQKDQSFSDLEAGYRADFARRKPGMDKEWVPTVEEVYAEGRTAFVRSVWEARIKSADGTVVIKDRNRSIDVFRLGEDGRWRIFRSLNYPEKR